MERKFSRTGLTPIHLPLTITVMNVQTFSLATVFATSIALTLSNVSPAAASNLVVNGSFEESPTLKDGGWGTYDAIKGWTATTGGKIEVQRGAAGKAYDGKQLVELDSHHYDKNAAVLGLFQDLVTKPGQWYTLSFAYSARPNVTAAENVFSVLFGNNFKQTVRAGAGSNQTNWNLFSVDVLATSELTRLQFNNEGSRDTLGAYIDDVEVTASAVPEPMTMAGMAIAGLGLAANKKLKNRRVSKKSA